MQHLPEALVPMGNYAQFILFKLIRRPDKTDKLPVDHRTLKVFAAGAGWQQDPAAWTTFANASFLAEQLGPDYGIGFFFTPSDPFFFLDIDKCLEPCGTKWSPLANDIMARLPGAAVEISQSGRGLHLFGTYEGAAPDHACKNTPLDIELYTSGRFVALTGAGTVGSAGADCTINLAAVVAMYFAPTAAAPDQDWTTEAVPEYTGPEDDTELLNRALSSKPSASAILGGTATFAHLWAADEDVLSRAYPDNYGVRAYDESSADMALAQHLAFWTGKNCERMLGLMRQSALVRDKWERDDYLPRTVLRAASMQTAVYSVVAAEQPDTTGLPKLRGTEKQVAYAERIRAEKIAESGRDAPLDITLGPARSASFWIDHKDDTVEGLIPWLTPLDKAEPPKAIKEPERVIGFQFMGPDQQVELFQGCAYVQRSHRMFVPSGVLLKSEQFNATYGGYEFQINDSGKTVRKAFEAFTESQLVRFPKVETTCFRPDKEPGALLERDGQLQVNTYVPVVTERKQGDPEPFLRHLRLTLPEPNDQAILLAYMAALIQHKGVKFQWAPVIQGVEGNGKTLFTRCVARAIGEKYVHMPPASEISEKFNEWLFGKLFIGVEDIYVPDQKREVIEILKPMITNERQPCRAMQQSQVMQDCCANFLFNSNHQDGLRKTLNDRRFCMFFTAQQAAADLARDGMTGDYFPKLYDWLRAEGYAIVADFLHTYQIPDELNPAVGCHRAPETTTTKAAIAAGLGGVEQEILEAVDEGRPGFAGGWVSSVALELLLKNMRRDSAIPPNKRRALLQSLGYDWHPALKNGRVNNPVAPDGKKPRLFIKAGHIAINIEAPKAVADAYEQAQSISEEDIPFASVPAAN